MVLARCWPTSRWGSALNRAKGEKARQCCQSKNQRRLSPGEVRGCSQQIVNRLIAKILGIGLHAIGYSSNEPRNLRSILFEVLGGVLDRASKLSNDVRTVGELSVQQLLHVVGKCRSRSRNGRRGGSRAALKGICSLGPLTPFFG
jgi:hypothetical protein